MNLRIPVFMACLLASQLFLATTDGRALTDSELAAIQKTLAKAPAAELPIISAELVARARSSDKEATAVAAVRAAITRKPAAAVSVVSSTVKAAPSAGPAVAAAATALAPDQAADIRIAAELHAPAPAKAEPRHTVVGNRPPAVHSASPGFESEPESEASAGGDRTESPFSVKKHDYGSPGHKPHPPHPQKPPHPGKKPHPPHPGHPPGDDGDNDDDDDDHSPGGGHHNGHH